VAAARATDEAEDELYGEARGDELPEQLRTPEAGAVGISWLQSLPLAPGRAEGS
jgi:hypothetical protein